VNVSVKISAIYSQMNPADPEDAIAHHGAEAALDPPAARAKSARHQFRHGELRAQKYDGSNFPDALSPSRTFANGRTSAS